MSETEKKKQNVRLIHQKCAVDGCDKAAHYTSTGLCAMHHRRKQRHGVIGQAKPMRERKTA